MVVADTSVLINLCRVRQEDLLKRLFHEVIIPPEVADEFARLTAANPRFARLSLPAGIRLQTPAHLAPVVQAATSLDPGESAALSLALEIHADAILLDERRGHKVAIALGLTTIVLLGILLQAKSMGLLPAVLPVIDALQRDAGFGFPSRCENRCSGWRARRKPFALPHWF